MADYVPCEGGKLPAVALRHSPAIPSVGVLDPGSPAKTFGTCSACDYTVMSKGIVNMIMVPRHKPRHTEDM